MFYCDECAKARKWPDTFSKSRGRCEQCGHTAICNDMPSGALANHEKALEQHGSTDAAQKAYVKKEAKRRKAALTRALEQNGIDADTASKVVEILSHEGLPEVVMFAPAVLETLSGKERRAIYWALRQQAARPDVKQ